MALRENVRTTSNTTGRGKTHPSWTKFPAMAVRRPLTAEL
jgi:hypothetical protein